MTLPRPRTWMRPLTLASVALATLTLSALTSHAQPADVVLYEVTETMAIKGGKIARRVATAGLLGTARAGTPLCPDRIAAGFGVDRCAVTAFAFDNIDLRTGRGPVSGEFAVVVQDLNLVDGPEVVILRGTFSGDIDLSPALVGRDGTPLSGDEVPLAKMSGRYSAQGAAGTPLAGSASKGTMAGTFRLPFPSGVDGQTAVYLLSPSPWSEEPVGASERIFGSPMVRLELRLGP